MHNNSLYGFHYCKDTYLCYKKITREYRLVRGFNFITPYEVSQSVLLGLTRTDIFVNKYDNASQDPIYQTEELIAQVVRSFSPV